MIQYRSIIILFLLTYKHVVQQEIFKYSHYVFAFCTSRVAPCMAIPHVGIPHVAITCMVVSRVVILHVPFYTHHSMTISYTIDHFAHLASSCI